MTKSWSVIPPCMLTLHPGLHTSLKPSCSDAVACTPMLQEEYEYCSRLPNQLCEVTSLLQVWCQASEDDQAAGIAIVTACMEAAQDVSLTPSCLSSSLHVCHTDYSTCVRVAICPRAICAAIASAREASHAFLSIARMGAQ